MGPHQDLIKEGVKVYRFGYDSILSKIGWGGNRN